VVTTQQPTTPATTPATTTPGRFTGKTALITGAASGIGLATAHRLAAEGADVALLDLSPAVHAVADELAAEQGRPDSAIGVLCDVADPAAWEEAMRVVRSRLGGVDVLVANAFINQLGAAHEIDLATWNRLLGVNLTGAFLGVQACLPDLVERRGAVVFTSSVHALFGLPGHPAYAAAKGGMTALTRQLAAEYGRSVRVNAVLPGPILTPTWDDVSEEDRARSVEQTVQGRFGTAEEVAAAIAFLASPEASYVTGASLVVDGGWSIFKTSA
jgi:NAD(P)-dependent dehydrogenase (short-subunit alcohol dehydrogenase family)